MYLLIMISFSFKKYFDLEEFNNAVDQVVPTWAELSEEFEPCFCHNDMHVLNLIYNEEAGKICMKGSQSMHTNLTDGSMINQF